MPRPLPWVWDWRYDLLNFFNTIRIDFLAVLRTKRYQSFINYGLLYYQGTELQNKLIQQNVPKFGTYTK